MSRTTIATSLLGRVVSFGPMPNSPASERLGRIVTAYGDPHVKRTLVDVEFDDGTLRSGMPIDTHTDGSRHVLVPDIETPGVRVVFKHLTGHGVQGIGPDWRTALKQAVVRWCDLFSGTILVAHWSITRLDSRSLTVELITTGDTDPPYDTNMDAASLAEIIMESRK